MNLKNIQIMDVPIERVDGAYYARQNRLLRSELTAD